MDLPHSRSCPAIRYPGQSEGASLVELKSRFLYSDVH